MKINSYSKIIGTLNLTLMILSPMAWASSDHGSHSHGAHGDEELSQPFEWSLTEGWLDPLEHAHASPLGTPLVHPFTVEPAFTGRDLFLDYSFESGPEGIEHEIEAEIEWAFTRRLGIIVELPYEFLEPEEDSSVDGIGDLAITPRFLVAEHNRFLLTANLEIEVPTGRESLGLGSGEVALAPSLSSWVDLGGWFALNSQVGVEKSVESDEAEFFFRHSLSHTIGYFNKKANENSEKGPLTAGLLSILFEVDGEIGLSGDEDGVVTAEALIGLYYGLTEDIDIRAGYRFPLTSPREVDDGATVGLVVHF